MIEVPTLDTIDYAAGISALLLLVAAYVVYPNTIFKYSVWLTVFTIWMAWFVYYGTKWMYDIDA